MSAENKMLLATALVIVLGGAVAWGFAMRPALEVHAEPLLRLPHELGGWRAIDVPMDQSVESMLRADCNVQRAWRHPMSEQPVWLYVGYYGTERGGHPEHTPEVCYGAHGWRVASHRRIDLDIADGARANELRVVNESGQQRLVLFWYRSHRRPALAGRFSVAVDHVLGRLATGRADGALVRLSTPLAPGELEARARLLRFARLLEPELAARWPDERPRLAGSE